MKNLIAWFQVSTPPARPFQLNRAVTVLNPGRWWDSIAADIEAGPLGPRARYGALQADLRRLYAIMVDGDMIERP